MKRIYKINNEWLRAGAMLFCLLPIFIRHCWIRGIVGKVIAIAIVLFILVKSFSCFRYHERTLESDYQIIDLSDAYDSGICRARTDYIVIHHTAMMSNIKTSILAIADIHMKQHGWSSIGYQYLIMNGNIYKLHNDNDIAPHTEGYNSSSIAICVHGNYSKEFLSETDRNKLIWLIKKLQDKYRIDASKVVKHGDLNATECCGNNININELRKCLKNY